MQQADRAQTRTIGRSEMLVDGSDAAFRNMLHDMLAFYSRLEQVRADFGAHIGLTGVQFTILITIRQLHDESDHGVGVKEVAEHLGFSPAFVTQETNRLARIGVLGKVRNPDDQRRVSLTLTDEGEARLTRLAPLQRQVNDALFAPLDRADFETQQRIARRLRQSSEQAVSLSARLFNQGEMTA